MKADWHVCIDNRVGFKVFAVPKESQEKVVEFSFHGSSAQLRHGDVVIASITSCTNTSNPSVMLGAGLVAKKACELGLEVKPWIKTSLAPGSGVETKYFGKIGLQKYLNRLGFNIVGYGCTTCIGNSGDIDEAVAAAITENDIVAVVVSSGNRNSKGHGLRDDVLIMTVSQRLRKQGVVGEFEEFYGEGMSKSSLAGRAIIANMSPEYGVTTVKRFPESCFRNPYISSLGLLRLSRSCLPFSSDKRTIVKRTWVFYYAVLKLISPQWL